MIKVAPSILSADFLRLGEDIASISAADYIHYDVMDGVFVPNISFGMSILTAVRSCTDMVIDAHLMITRPLRYVKEFAKAGADIITVHAEADTPDNIAAAIAAIKAEGKKAGLSVKPGTPASAAAPYIADLDLILVMTVEPGFGGQSFMADMMDKVRQIRAMIDAGGYDCELEVDGGINPDTARVCVEAGANVLVAGSSVFGAADRAQRIAQIRG